MPFDYAALEAAREARDPRNFLAAVDLPKPARPEPRGTWSVVRTYDDAAKHDEPIRVNCTEADARKWAGELRDAMTDADCSKGFQILAKNKTKFRFPTQEQRSARAAIAGRKSWANRGKFKFQGFTKLTGIERTPEDRKRVSRLANAGRK